MRPYRGLTWKNKKTEWIFGWYSEIDGKSFITIKSGLALEVIPSTVGQSTGLHDRNGNELDWWEGNRFKFYLNGIWRIVFLKGAFYFERESDGELRLCYLVSMWVNLPEKIGTIHDNLELLKK